MSESRFPQTDPQVAAQQTDNWREYYAYTAYAATHFDGNIPVDSPEYKQLKDEAFRGFRLPVSDLRQILKNIDEYNNDQTNEEAINSVRVYLARDVRDPALPADPHVYLVPVVGGEEIPNPLQQMVRVSRQQYGSDLLKLNDGTAPVYNFSTPCPKQCDTASILFSLSNVTNDNVKAE